MNFKWSEITKQDVIDAVNKFITEKPEHPQAKNTFLIFNNQKLPAKHIRYMAYKIHFPESNIKKRNFSGGEQTADFFRKLGFEVEYKEASKDKSL